MSLLSTLNLVLDRHYEETLDYVYLKYHNFESPIPNIPITEAGREEIRFFDGFGQSLGRQHTSVPSSKSSQTIIFDRDPNFHNGLPRKKR